MTVDVAKVQPSTFVSRGKDGKLYQYSYLKPEDTSALQLDVKLSDGRIAKRNRASIFLEGKEQRVYILDKKEVTEEQVKEEAKASQPKQNKSQQSKAKWYDPLSWFAPDLTDKWAKGVDKFADENIFQINDNVACEDGEDDGEISFWEKLKYTARGVLAPFKEIVKRPGAALATMAAGAVAMKGIALGCAAVGVACPPLGLIMAGVGLAIGVGMVAVNGYKILTQETGVGKKTDAETRRQWESLGTGATTAVMSYKAMSKMVAARNAGNKFLADEKTKLADSVKNVRQNCADELAQNPLPKNKFTKTGRLTKAYKDAVAARQAIGQKYAAELKAINGNMADAKAATLSQQAKAPKLKGLLQDRAPVSALRNNRPVADLKNIKNINVKGGAKEVLKSGWGKLGGGDTVGNINDLTSVKKDIIGALARKDLVSARTALTKFDNSLSTMTDASDYKDFKKLYDSLEALYASHALPAAQTAKSTAMMSVSAYAYPKTWLTDSIKDGQQIAKDEKQRQEQFEQSLATFR